MSAALAALTLLTFHRPLSSAIPTLPTPTALLTAGRWSVTSDSAAIPTGAIVTASLSSRALSVLFFRTLPLLMLFFRMLPLWMLPHGLPPGPRSFVAIAILTYSVTTSRPGTVLVTNTVNISDEPPSRDAAAGVEDPSSDSLDVELSWQRTEGLAGIVVEGTCVDATT